MLFGEYKENIVNLVDGFPMGNCLAMEIFESLFKVVDSMIIKIVLIDKTCGIFERYKNNGYKLDLTDKFTREAVFIISDLRYIISVTPLRYFLLEFSKSPCFWLRSAARFELSEGIIKFLNIDEEIRFMAYIETEWLKLRCEKFSSLDNIEWEVLLKTVILSTKSKLLEWLEVKSRLLSLQN